MSRNKLTLEKFEELIGTDEYIHTFIQAGNGGPLIGASWERKKLVAAAKEFGSELSGEEATSMKHGVVFHDGGKYVFVKTIQDKP